MDEPRWLADLLSTTLPAEGASVDIRGLRLVRRDGILRSEELRSPAQKQTCDAFAFKWARRNTFESPASLKRMRRWLIERYGEVQPDGWIREHGPDPILLDAGCGAGMSALELFGSVLDRIRYVGVDVSTAVDVARERFAERGSTGAFLQTDLARLPFPDASVDIVFSEGVLHHTDSPEESFRRLTRLLRPGGRILFYVYRRKGPIREFTDDRIRAELQEMTPNQAWDAMLPLTRLGRTLGELDAEIEVPEDVALLGIPAGRTTVQRLFYWHVCKAFYDPDLTLEELNHINYDWYAPRNASRHTPEEVRSWCEADRLEIERERIEPAGITIIARRPKATQ